MEPPSTVVLDREQLEDVTLGDDELMREILATLIDDTSKQLAPLDAAIRGHDSEAAKRLAHYSKGACANVGAKSAAAALADIEHLAVQRNFEECSASLAALAVELDRLRVEADSMLAR